MGFMDGIRDVLGGFNAVKRINDTGFDWREQDAAQQFARDRKVEEARQADEDRAVNQIADAYAGAEGGQEPDVSPLLQGIEERRQKFMLDRARGVGKERKSALEDQKTYRTIQQQAMRGQQGLDLVGARSEAAEALARVKAEIEAGRQPSPRDLALIQERGKIQEGLFDRAEAGRNYRAQNFGVGGRGGRPQLRLVSDGQGGTEYRWISPGDQGIPGPPTASQRETSGMAEDISSAMSEMRDLAPDVTHGPILGRLSEAWQSQYPSGKEADFDNAIARLVNFAYIKSGKQINRIELEQDLRKLISRSRGDLPGQVERAMPYVERILKPYERTGAIGGGGGETRTYGGVTYRLKPGADPKRKSSWEPVK